MEQKSSVGKSDASRMQAAVVSGVGQWVYQSVPKPAPVPGHVLVRTQQAGICSTDVLRSFETGFYHYPIVPGHEFCGVVDEVAKDVTNVRVGDRVAVYPLIACGRCFACSKGKPNLCDSYDFLGSRCNGGYAEFVLAPSQNLILIPDEVSFSKAVMTEPSAVALHGHKVAGTSPEVESAVIFGLGPIGLMVAQWAKVLGVKQVIGVDRNSSKLAICRKIGVETIIDSSKSDVVETIRSLTQGIGAEIIFECSGSEELQQNAVMSCRKLGQVVILGNPLGNLNLTSAQYSLILRRELSIKGSWSSLIAPYNEWEETLDFMAKGLIDPSAMLTHQFPLSQAAQVMRDMYTKEFKYSKVSFNFADS